MIPSFIDQNDPKRGGERMVFEWLSQDTIPGAAFYSLHQKNHKYKLISEVDFLYVCNRGMLCIEVKGGKVYRKERIWHSINKRGQDFIIHNPFDQAIGCQNALKSYVKEEFGYSSRQANCLIGYAVVFPECIFTGSGNDLVTDVVFDGKSDLQSFPNYLNSVFDYWEEQELKKHGKKSAGLSDAELKSLVELFRGDFGFIPSMHLELQHAEAKMIKLTDEQYDTLDIADDNPRVIIQGGAGTGKSLLAVEMCRRYAARNYSVLYLCYNRNMAQYAKRSIGENDKITVSTFHAILMKMIGTSSGFNRSPKELSQLFLSLNSRSNELFDAIVIDEGQDLLNIETIGVINSLLKQGLEESHWVMLLDPNQNIFNCDEEYEATLEYVRELYSPVVLKLRTNCRNTEQIARRTAALTIVPPAKYLKVTGPKVVVQRYETEKEFFKLLRREIMSLQSSGVSPKDMVILSKKTKDHSILHAVDELCNIRIIERNNIDDVGKPYLNFFTIQSFKGLESNVVFLVDIDGFKSLENRQLNYVAMSRAKIQLQLFFPKTINEEYEETLDKGRALL